MKIMAIGFFGNTKTQLNAMDATGWCDTYYPKPNDKIGGISCSLEEIQALNIPFKKYDAALIFHESTSSPSQRYFLDECHNHGITIYANQHGFNKSILQIIDTPNIYSKYWNCMGKYFLNRFEQVTGRSWLSQRWISIGSLMHDYLYKNYKWSANNNGKVLLIHEPDLTACEGDPHSHKSEQITRELIKALKQYGLKVDMKLHPNWKYFIGNDGSKLDKPEGVKFVDIPVEEIVDYKLVVGSRSTMLLDAAAMNIPTMAIVSKSNWEDDKYPPVEEGENGLIPTYKLINIERGLDKCFGRVPKYDIEKLQYYVGGLGTVAERYYQFIKDDLKNPQKLLGQYYSGWQKQLDEYTQKEKGGLRKLFRKFTTTGLYGLLKKVYKIIKVVDDKLNEPIIKRK